MSPDQTLPKGIHALSESIYCGRWWVRQRYFATVTFRTFSSFLWYLVSSIDNTYLRRPLLGEPPFNIKQGLPGEWPKRSEFIFIVVCFVHPGPSLTHSLLLSSLIQTDSEMKRLNIKNKLDHEIPSQYLKRATICPAALRKRADGDQAL